MSISCLFIIGGEGGEHVRSRVIMTNRNEMQIMYKALNSFTCRRAHTQTHTHRSGPQWSLLKSSSSRKGSWRPEPALGPVHLVWSSTIRLDGTRTRSTMPLQAPGTEEERRMPGTGKPTRPDESISGTSNLITAKPTLTLTPNPDADVHIDLLP